MTTAENHIIRSVDISDIDQRVLFGQNGMYIRLIESQFDVKIVARGETIMIEGNRPEVENVPEK